MQVLSPCQFFFPLLGRVIKVAVPYRAKDTPSERSEFGHPDVAIITTLITYCIRHSETSLHTQIIILILLLCRYAGAKLPAVCGCIEILIFFKRKGNRVS